MPYPLRCSQGLDGADGTACACLRLAAERDGSSRAAAPFPVVCWVRFSILQTQLCETDFRAQVEDYLLETELQLEKIAHLRALGDFPAASAEAGALSLAAIRFGAVEAGAAAARLQSACHACRRVASYRLLSELGEVCRRTAFLLEAWSAALPRPAMEAFANAL